MKKIFKLFLIFTLVFTFSFIVKAEEPEVEEFESALVTIAPVVSVKSNNNTVVLSWTGDENAVSFIVERSTDAKKGFKKIATVTETTYTDKKLSYGKKYYYKVTAKGASNKLTSSVVSKKIVPNRITNVTVSATSNTTKLAWGKNATTGYYVFESTDQKKWTKVATINKNKTVTLKLKKKKPNTTYYYQVQAFQKDGKKYYTGSKSDVVSAKTLFNLPSVKVKSSGLHTLIISIKKINSAAYYEIYQYDPELSEYVLYSSPYNAYATNGVIEEYTYTSAPYTNVSFKVRACKTPDNCSSFVTVTGQTKIAKPNIYSIKGGNKYVNVRFSSEDSGEEGLKFEVYRSTSKNGKYSKIATKLSSDYPYIINDKKVSNNKTYYYKIRSVVTIKGKKYTSKYSGIVNVKTGKGAEVTSAKNDALRLVKDWPYSKKMLISILSDSFEYTKDQATSGVKKAKIDFKKNAYKIAKYYAENYGLITESHFREYLSYDEFTESEIVYALNKLKVNWKNRLKDQIKEELKYGVSKEQLLSWYANDSYGLSESQVLSVINDMNIDFNKQAVLALKYVFRNKPEKGYYNRPDVRNNLHSSLGFTEEETEYALANVAHDWAGEIVNEYNNSNTANDHYSRSVLVEFYTSDEEGFTEEECNEAFSRLEVDFAANALFKAREALTSTSFSKQALKNRLVEVFKFTEEEADSAVNNEEFNYDLECVEFVNANYMSTELSLEEIREELVNVYLFTNENVDYAFDVLGVSGEVTVPTLEQDMTGPDDEHLIPEFYEDDGKICTNLHINSVELENEVDGFELFDSNGDVLVSSPESLDEHVLVCENPGTTKTYYAKTYIYGLDTNLYSAKSNTVTINFTALD